MSFQNAVEIAPPGLRRLPGLLLDVAAEIPDVVGDRWLSGVTFPPLGSGGLSRLTPSFCDDDTYDQLLATEGCATFAPFSVYGAEEGTTLDWDANQLSARITAREAMLSEQLTAELFASTDSPSLNDSAFAVPGGPFEALRALAAVEAILAMVLHGAEGIVWMPPGMTTVVAQHLYRDGSTYRTPTGHRVASDPGAFGQVPDGESANPETAWIYGSGPVLYKVGDVVDNVVSAEQYLDRDRNTILAQQRRYAIVAFDPATVVAAEAFYSGSGS